MSMERNQSGETPSPTPGSGTGSGRVFWRVEGSLLDLSAVRPVAYFTWNAQSFSERWARRGGVAALALVRPLLYAGDRVLATRVLHALLRGITRDRLDLLGEEYFQYVLKPQLKLGGVASLKKWMEEHGPVTLASQALDHVMLPLAQHLGVRELAANRLEFRDGWATGRLLEPVIRPRGPLALLTSGRPDGHRDGQQLARDLNLAGGAAELEAAVQPARRPAPRNHRALVVSNHVRRPGHLSVREMLHGKHILLIGVTGFIGKVWLANLLTDLPEVGKIYLLIRRQKNLSAQRRFEKIIEESPVFDPLHERLGKSLSRFLKERVEVIEGDVSQPGLGIEAKTRGRLERSLDLVVNSAGLVDFNPDLRDALAINVRGVAHLLHFLRATDHAGLVHISTCYVAGARNGRITEDLQPDYTPAHEGGFDAEREWKSLEEMITKVEERAESPEVTAALKRQLLGRRGEKAQLSEAELANQIRRGRSRWVRNRLTRVGMRRARHLGWPNTYTFTKSLAESLIAKRAADLPVAIVRPSIVESSTDQPFPGWNEGINTSAPLSYLLGTFFRQLPTNERKCLDLIPVDLVCRGLTLIGAAVIARRHAPLYQLATSTANPCDMGRSIELTSLAHRKHYRAQQGLEHWLRMRFEAIPVSKGRYRKLSVPAQKAVVQGINKIALPVLKRAPLARQERDLSRVEKLIELYEPFILHNEQVFEAQNVQVLSEALPEEEKLAFGYDAGAIDWWDYWINVHVPALRKWVYPLIEGRPLEPREKRSFQLSEPSENSTANEVPYDNSEQSKATWPSS